MHPERKKCEACTALQNASSEPSCGPGVCQAVFAVTLTLHCNALGKRHKKCQPAQGFQEMSSGQPVPYWRQPGNTNSTAHLPALNGVLPRSSSCPHCKRRTFQRGLWQRGKQQRISTQLKQFLLLGGVALQRKEKGCSQRHAFTLAYCAAAHSTSLLHCGTCAHTFGTKPVPAPHSSIWQSEYLNIRQSKCLMLTAAL